MIPMKAKEEENGISSEGKERGQTFGPQPVVHLRVVLL
jgi:hypothetical protein